MFEEPLPDYLTESIKASVAKQPRPFLFQHNKDDACKDAGAFTKWSNATLKRL